MCYESNSMDEYSILRDNIVQIVEDILTLFARDGTCSDLANHSFDGWESTCRIISRQLQEDIIRVAVVGPIKSGKSTFVNSLLGGDYLKRGAGVVTSIVTRIRRGPSLRAKLFFKFWDEVNSDINQAVVLFPSRNWRSDADPFEIRREKERETLQNALNHLDAEKLLTNETRNINSVLLLSYLKGYDRMRALISSDTLTTDYDESHFSEHKQFVGDDSLSVYLKDIQLEIDSDGLSENIEIADCQGSDSPNPLHIAKIQDYLLLTHLVIYVISSRIGLRQADIKFLTMIKKMGILDNILFIVNCDFNEHGSLDDLLALVKKIDEELLLIKQAPRIYTLSALYNLFNQQRESISEKDRLRLSQWQRESALVAYSDKETGRFESDFRKKLTLERSSLMLRNHVERLGIVSSGLRQWIQIHQDILARDTDGARELVDKIKQNQARMNQIKSMIRSTLDGAVQKIKNELKTDVDRFFDLRSGNVLGDIVGFIRNYHIDFDEFQKNKTSNFSATLYLLFQDFKQHVDSFMAEETNPKIIQFIKEEEQRIQSFLDSVLIPYESIVQEAVSESENTFEKFSIAETSPYERKRNPTDFDSIKLLIGLKLPPSDATMRYNAKIKTEAVIRLGFYSALNLFKRILRKPIRNKREQEIQALKDGIKRMKRETEKSIASHFKDYKENVKFQYIFKLVDGASNHLHQQLMDRFQAYAADLGMTVDRISEKQFDYDKDAAALKDMAVASDRIERKIHSVREKIDEMLLQCEA